MKKFGCLVLALLVGGSAFAQTSIYNNITSPSDGAVFTSSYEPYDISIAGMASASNQSNLEIVITLDNSGSIGSSNFAIEKQAAQYLVSKLVNPSNSTQLLASVGIVSYATSGAIVLSPATTDAAAVATALSGLAYSGGNTNWQEGINLSRDIFRTNGNSGEEICFFFSDGQPNTPNSTSWQSAANGAYAEGIMFNTFGITNYVSETTMKQLAGEDINAGTDHYWKAPSFAQLQSAIDQALPATGSVSLDRVEVFSNGVSEGLATIGAAGTYTAGGVSLNYGDNTIRTVAYATDGTSATDEIHVTLNHPQGVPEPGTLGMLIPGLLMLIGGAIRMKKNS